jgi:hypothetical protein
MKAFVRLMGLAALLLGLMGDGHRSCAAAMHQPDEPPDWYVKGIAAAMLDPYPGMLSEIGRLPLGDQAVAKIAGNVPVEVQRRITERLLKEAVNEKSKNDQVAALSLLSRYESGAPHRVFETVVAISNTSEPLIALGRLTVMLRVAQTSKDDYRGALAAVRQQMAEQRDPTMRVYSIAAFVRLTGGEVDLRDEVIAPLVELSGDGPSRQTAVALLAEIAASNDRLRGRVVDSLLGKVAGAGQEQTAGIADAFGAVKSTDAAQSRAIGDALLRAANSKIGTFGVPPGVLAALGTVQLQDPSQRKSAVEVLTGSLKSNFRSTAQEAVTALANIAAEDDEHHAEIVATILDLTHQTSRWSLELAALGLGEIGQRAQERGLAVKELLRIAGNKEDRDAQAAAASSLSKISPIEENDRHAVVEAMMAILRSRDDYVMDKAARALAVHRPLGSELNSAIDVLIAALKGHTTEGKLAVAETLGLLAGSDDALTERVIDTLTKSSFEDSPESQQSAAAALGQIAARDPARRRLVLETLLRLSRTAVRDLQDLSAWALSQQDNLEPAGRGMVRDRFVDLAAVEQPIHMLTLPTIAELSQTGLLRNGPVEATQIVKLIGHIYSGDVGRVAYWRTLAWAFNGKLPYPKRQLLSDAGSVLLSFTGRLRDDQIPWSLTVGDPTGAAKALAIFGSLWNEIAVDAELRNDVVRRSDSIVSGACPSATKAPALSVEALDHEAVRTYAWLVGLVSARSSATRCWNGDDRETLADFLGKLEQLKPKGDLAPSIADLRAQFEADGAAPPGGLTVLGIFGWTLFWTGLIVAFPHSRRIRSVFLFNPKLRNLLSLWFVPVILSLLPPLRRRMLRPFRADLLRDARLDGLDEKNWFPNVFVRTAKGDEENVALAISDIRGTTILSGESGLGKSAFLRMFANGLNRSVVFLEATACEKGVEEAIARCVPGLHDARFLEALIYAKDLAVVIDGLNEASAETRAIIAMFANKAGGPDILIGTQPIEGIYSNRSPFARAAIYDLLPLRYEDISRFLKRLPIRDDPKARVHEKDYDEQVERFIRRAIRRAPSKEDRSMAELILTNPLDLIYASELIAGGDLPKPYEMIEQAVQLANKSYRKVNGLDLPQLSIANKCVELRKEKRNWLGPDDLIAEQDVLREYRLLVPSLRREGDKQIIVMRFRHERVLDVLTKPAFDADPNLQLEFADDDRFRGVYLLYAQAQDRKTARRLRTLLSSRAAHTRNHTLSDEFIRRFELGEVDDPIESTDPEEE